MSSQDTSKDSIEARIREVIIVLVVFGLICIILLTGFSSLNYASSGSEAQLLVNISIILACGLSAIVILLSYFVLEIYSKD